ncbi:MAG: hypothetical protein Q4G70_01370 [Pseudomonadota bacterium]|nr:hypothetical protein [Pseudomonadota bacterium]
MTMDYSRFAHHRALPGSRAGERQARMLETMGAPALHRRNADGSTSRKVGERLYVQTADEQATQNQLSRLAWVPEGMVITPRSKSAPRGWGLPPTADGKGTPGGDFPYVVINRYRHNNTPEYLHTVYSASPYMRGNDVSMTLNWPALYLDAAEVGAWKNGRRLPQFVGRWLPLLKERRQDAWFAHRPQVRPWPFELMHAVLLNTNGRRATFDMPPVSQPLAGWTPDLAQAICDENVRARQMAHGSPDFRPGWQTLAERQYARAGQPEGVGENLYANNTAKGAALGANAVEWWVNSPGHDATMRVDYTFGQRAASDADGSPQYRAEVMTVGTWPRADLGAGSRMREVTQVFSSAGPRDARCTTWRHPRFGSISVSGPPGIFVCAPVNSLHWSTSEMVSYRHTDIEVVRQTEQSVQTSRAHVLGAALCASGAPQPDAKAVATWVREKQLREASYNRARATAGLPSDDACAGSEADVLEAAHGQELALRTLMYEEYGPIHLAPAPGAVCRLVVREGRAEDFLATQREIGAVVLPFSPVTIPVAARFSEDGRRVACAVGEHLDDGSGRWAGERLHFYEFVDGQGSEVATSEIDIRVHIDEGVHEHSAAGRCHLFPFYSGNELRFVDLSIDHHGSVTGQTSARRLFSELVFPGGASWLFCSTASDANDARVVTGLVRHLLYLDPERLERGHWIEYTLEGDGSNTVCAARVMRNMVAPELVRTLYQRVQPQTPASGLPWLVPLWSSANVGNWSHRVHPSWPFGLSPDGDFKASFTYGAVGIPRPAQATHTFGDASTRTPRATPLAPTCYARFSGYPDRMYDATFDGEYVLAGRLVWQMFGIGLDGAPAGHHHFFHSSSLDLAEITGIDDLADNILPVWTL